MEELNQNKKSNSKTVWLIIGGVALVIIAFLCGRYFFANCNCIGKAIPANTVTSNGKANTPAGNGKFVLSYENDPQFSQMISKLKERKVGEEAVGILNDNVALPYNIEVKYMACDDANAWFDP